MNRALVTSWAALALALSSPAAQAQPFAGDVLELRSIARITGTNGIRYVVETIVRRESGGSGETTTLTVVVSQACPRERCSGVSYTRELDGEELQTDAPIAGPVSGAELRTTFGGKKFRIEWALGEPEPRAADPPPRIVLHSNAVSANNVLNASCFGTGRAERWLEVAPDRARRPEGRPFPDRLPRAFVARGSWAPTCTSRSPH